MIQKQREQYEAPSTDVVLLRMETGILITSDPLNNPNNGYVSGWDLGDI